MNELYWSENRMELLKRRKKRCVCHYCGGPLSIKRILFSDVADARIELYCERCERIEFGIEPEVYLSASNFVDNLDVDFYENMDDNDLKHQMNVAKVGEIMAWGFRNVGMLDDDGFTMPLQMKDEDWQECMVLESSQVPEDVASENAGVTESQGRH